MCCLSPLSFGSVEYEKRSATNALEPCALFGDRKEMSGKRPLKSTHRQKTLKDYFVKEWLDKIATVLYYYF